MGLTTAILVGVGTAANVTGQVMAGNAAADAQRKSAAIKQQQASELESREIVNEGIEHDMERRQEDVYMSLGSSSGGEGTNIGGILRMRSDLERTIANNQRDAAFKAKMLREGADIDLNLASDAQTAGYFGGAGTLLTGASSVYGIYRKNSSTQTLFPPESKS